MWFTHKTKVSLGSESTRLYTSIHYTFTKKVTQACLRWWVGRATDLVGRRERVLLTWEEGGSATDLAGRREGVLLTWLGGGRECY